MRRLSALWLSAIGLVTISPVQAWFFYWANTAYQCNVQTLSWQGGTAPYSAWIVPIYGQPFIYDIPDDAYSNGYGDYDILVQLNAGTSYIVVMSDATGLGAGGSSQIHRVSVSNQTSCLYTANQNASSLDFTFTVSGVAEQCERGFELAWTGGKEYGPYNFTVIPLDQSFTPFDVELEHGVSSMSDWQMNITKGARFTIMMNDASGYGTGGVAGIYEVDPDPSTSNDTSCINQEIYPTGSWPVGLATNTLSAATLPVTEPAGSNKGLSGGAIAGIVIGIVALLLIVFLALFFLRRRKRQRDIKEQKVVSDDVDLAEGEDGTAPNRVSMAEPYHRLDPFTGGQDGTNLGDDSASGTITSAGFAGLGARLSDARSRETVEDVPGMAGPLPTKSRTSISDSPTSSSQPVSNFGLKNDLLSHSSSPRTPTSGQAGGPMRVVNHDNPATLPALPPGARLSDDRSRRRLEGGPTFRRHADAGRVPVTRPHEEDVVDLPPLYTDVPRDGDVELGNGGSPAEGGSSIRRV